MAEFMHGVINVLAHLEVPFSTACELVVEGMRHLGQFGLWHQLMRNAAQVLDRAVVEEVPHLLTEANAP